MSMQINWAWVAACAVMGAAGCGRETSAPAPTEDASTAAAVEESVAPSPATPSAASTVSVDDIELWKRGMEAERKAVQDAAAKLAQAKDENEKLEALTASMEMSTIDAAASAAGVDRDRYRRIRNTLSDAVSQLSPIEMEMDVSKMPPEMVEQMKQARASSVSQLEANLPPDVFEALKARAAELREQDKLLVAERLKVATSAR
jgi:hypothetical protein